MYSKSVYDVWQEITISSYSINTIFLTVHNILHPTPKPTARRHRTTGDIPGTCVQLFDCWRLLNNESIPGVAPRAHGREQCKGRCWDGGRCTARVIGEHMCNGEHYCVAHLIADDTEETNVRRVI